MDKFVANPPPPPKPLVKKKAKVLIKDQSGCNMDKFVKQRPVPPPPPPPVMMLPPPAVLSQQAVKDLAQVSKWEMKHEQLYKLFTKDDGNVYILAFCKFFMIWPCHIKTLDRGLTVLEKETVWADNVKYPLISYDEAFSKRVPSTSL